MHQTKVGVADLKYRTAGGKNTLAHNEEAENVESQRLLFAIE